MWYTADMWSFWSLYLGPTLLARKFQNAKYHRHFVDLIRLLHVCLQYESTHEDVSQVRAGFSNWVKEFEEYYYQYSPARLSTCLLTIHALLHVADSIETIGPVWAYWAFPMERYCGRLQRCIKSRRFPFANIDTFVVADARLKQLGFRFAFLDVSCLLQNPLDYVYSLTQSLVDDSDTCVVAPPYRGPSAVNDAQLIRRVQVSLATRFDTTLSVVRRFVPDRPQNLALYGKVRRLGAGDTIWASSLTPGAEDRSDASWVRYQIFIDRNARYRNRAPDFEKTTCYGKLLHIVVVTLPPSRELRLTGETKLLLADVITCKTEFEGPLGEPLYKNLEAPQVIDMTCIQSLVGRFEVKNNSQVGWAIIYRSEENGDAIAVTG
ncbi:hypothetical protein BC629DRAFT_1659586, partial [Irpex lacteus]